MATRLSTGPGSGPTSRRLPSAERRAAIVLAAREVFCAAGLRGARMRAIAERAGVTEPLLYRHFASREELYQVAVEEHFTRLLDDTVAAARRVQSAPSGPRKSRIMALTRIYLDAMVAIAPLAAVALYEDRPRGSRLYQAVVRPRLREAAAALYQVSTGGELPVGAENLVAVSLFGVPFGVALDGMLRGRPVDLEDMAGRIARLFPSR